jgi:hypothetical protein
MPPFYNQRAFQADAFAPESNPVLALTLALALATASSPLPFVENDYAAALAQARARDVPLFVEAWAPW